MLSYSKTENNLKSKNNSLNLSSSSLSSLSSSNFIEENDMLKHNFSSSSSSSSSSSILKKSKHSVFDKTKKIKNNNISSLEEKKKLWNEFNVEFSKNTPLECIDSKITERDNCEKCNFILAFSEEGFLTCTNENCGIIYKDTLDHSCEWRYYGADDNQATDPNRVGLPIDDLLKESSYGCKILCDGRTSYEMRKIRRYTEYQSVQYKEKSQYEQFQVIKSTAQNSGIPLIIVNDAIKYHKMITEYEQTFRGENKDGITAASVYISCRVNNYPRTPKEIATIFNLDSISATRGCKTAQIILNHLERDKEDSEKTNFCRTKPELFIERYCSKLNINSELTQLCEFICHIVNKNNMMAQNAPHSIASGIVYFIAQVCNLNITKTDIKNISEISEVTINKCYRKLISFDKNILIPKEMQKKYNINY